ncbi:MAG: phage tail protein [Cyanobacteria bacterium]|nr:phage tail protein [Cyanobacteriota bacterium]
MAAGEVLACSKFYFTLDGLEEKVIQKVSGIGVTLEVAGDSKSFGVSKEGKSNIQATVTGVSNSDLTVTFVGTAQDDSLMKWYRESHSVPSQGGGASSEGVRKTGTITLFNQGGAAAAEWTITGVFPKSYKSSEMDPSSTDLFTEEIVMVYESLARTK